MTKQLNSICGKYFLKLANRNALFCNKAVRILLLVFKRCMFYLFCWPHFRKTIWEIWDQSISRQRRKQHMWPRDLKQKSMKSSHSMMMMLLSFLFCRKRTVIYCWSRLQYAWKSYTFCNWQQHLKNNSEIDQISINWLKLKVRRNC